MGKARTSAFFDNASMPEGSTSCARSITGKFQNHILKVIINTVVCFLQSTTISCVGMVVSQLSKYTLVLTAVKQYRGYYLEPHARLELAYQAWKACVSPVTLMRHILVFSKMLEASEIPLRGVWLAPQDSHLHFLL